MSLTIETIKSHIAAMRRKEDRKKEDIVVKQAELKLLINERIELENCLDGCIEGEKNKLPELKQLTEDK